MSKAFDVCVVGLGPAGIATALRLATIPSIRLLCVDAGPDVADRSCALLENGPCRWASPCEMLAGLGGAALLSGGKLSLYPAGRSMAPLVGGPNRTRALLTGALEALRAYVPVVPPTPSTNSMAAATSEFRDSSFSFRYYESYRYRRSDLAEGFRRMRAFLEAHGHDVRLLTTVHSVTASRGQFSLTLRTGKETHVVTASRLILATGRSGTRLLSKLGPSFPSVRHLGRYDVGVRLEFPYSSWPSIDAHHNDLKLEFRDARTFCVCTNGSLAPYRVNNSFLLEGYSDPACQSGLTNLGLVIRVLDKTPDFLDDILSRVASTSAGRPIREPLDAYLGVRTKDQDDLRSSITFWQPGRVSRCYPDDFASQIRAAVNRFAIAFIPRRDWSRAAVFAPEIDYYWPTIDVQPDFRTAMDRLFVIGDATTRFRGILQSFASGLHVASTIKRDILRAS